MKSAMIAIVLSMSAVIATAADIGADAPDLALGETLKGKAPTLAALKGKSYLVLHFWTTNCKPCDEAVPKINAMAAKYGAQNVAFLAIGSDDPATLRKSKNFADYNVPVAADDMVRTADRYLRASDRLPTDVIVGKDGKVLWIGPSAALEGALTAVLDGTYNFEEAVDFDRFDREMTAAIQKNDHAAALALLDGRLKKRPDDVELIAGRCNLLARQLQQPEKAQVDLDAAIARLPKEFKLRETKINLLRFTNSTGKPVAETYSAIARDFADRPMLLVQLAENLMRQPVGEFQLGSVYVLTRAAYENGKFAGNREKGRAAAAYARSYYYVGKLDEAIKYQKIAFSLLKGTPDEKRATTDLSYYHTARQVADDIDRAQAPKK